MLASRRRRTEEDAGVEEYNADRTTLAPMEGKREGCWRPRKEDGIRCWHQGRGGLRRTLAPRRRRKEENADAGGRGEQRRALASRSRRTE